MNMIEKVAKRLFEERGFLHSPRTWDECREDDKDEYRAQARAAIEAMREPSAEAIKAGKRRLIQYDPDAPGKTDAATDIFRSMIDAALHEKAPA